MSVVVGSDPLISLKTLVICVYSLALSLSCDVNGHRKASPKTRSCNRSNKRTNGPGYNAIEVRYTADYKPSGA